MATAMKSTSRTLIVKEPWEKESLTSLLYGAEVIVYPRKEVDALERAYNGVARRLLGASPVEALQWELAWWPVKHRIAKLQLCYYEQLFRLGDRRWGKSAFREQLDKRVFLWMENIRCQAVVYDINLTDQVGTLDTWKRKVKKNTQAKMIEEW